MFKTVINLVLGSSITLLIQADEFFLTWLLILITIGLAFREEKKPKKKGFTYTLLDVKDTKDIPIKY